MMIHLLVGTLLLGLSYGVSWTYNPGCTDDTICGSANMLHVVTQSHQYLWSTQRGLSAIVFSGNESLSVDWASYNEGKPAITVSTPSTFGFTLKSLYLQNSTTNQTVDLRELAWGPVVILQPSDLTNTTRGNNITFSYSSSYITVMVNLSDSKGRMENLPKFKFTENNTVVELSLDMTKVPGLLVQDPDLGQIELEVAPGIDIKQKITRSFDDENAPALFSYNILQSNSTNTTAQNVYSMWRPVVYTDADRSVISTFVSGNIGETDYREPSQSLLSKYYSEGIRTLSLTLSPPDGKKQLSDKLCWNMVLGVGTPQSEGLSPMAGVLTVIIVVLPCAALLLGVGLVFLRKRRPNPGQGYRAI